MVETRGGKSKPLSLRVYRAPQVSGVQPDVAMPGDEVTITGLNLDGKPLTVSISGMLAEVKASGARDDQGGGTGGAGAPGTRPFPSTCRSEPSRPSRPTSSSAGFRW